MNSPSNPRFLADIKRTHMCGDLRKAQAGQQVVIMGWVENRRDHGGLVFVDLRDREGLIQVVLNPALTPTKSSKDLRAEFVLAVQGMVRERPVGMANPKLATGEIEVEASLCEILSEAEVPPFQIGDEKVNENLRLKYRYLDLRSRTLQKHMILRHKVTALVRSYLSDIGFLEVETPILYKSTPEGARDYLVPSRVHHGSFYALPQSPQILKQLLMVGGFDKYFQIARCFRDEDLRAERQPEFTQLDIEMSFVDRDDVIDLNEGLLRKIWKEMKGVEVGEVPRMSYVEVMEKFGSDKPDLRIPWEIKDLSPLLVNSGFKVFDDVLAKGNKVRGLAIPGLGKAGRSQFDKMTDMAKANGAKGMVWIKKEAGAELQSSVSKFFPPEKLSEVFKFAGGVEGGVVLVIADEYKVSSAVLSHFRSHFGKELGVIDPNKDSFLWVQDFPLFEYDSDLKRWMACHHPFTSPMDEDMSSIVSGLNAAGETLDKGKLKAKAYDLVCNGYEIAGGSVRIHSQRLQAAMFSALGLSEEQIQQKFGFFVEALSYGTPPHGGIAWGMDRLAMILCRTEAIRDVIAFPKTASATCMMSDAPSPVDREQLLELGIRTV